MKRALIVLVQALMGIHSPSLGRRVRISDIWNCPLNSIRETRR